MQTHPVTFPEMPRSKLAKSMATLKHTEKTQYWAIRGLLIRVLLGEKKNIAFG